MLKKQIAHIYNPETIPLSEMAIEKGLSENELLNLLIKKGYVLSNGKPTQKMLNEGLMMYEIISQNTRMIYDIYVTWKGYNFILSMDSQIKKKKKITYLKKH